MTKLFKVLSTSPTGSNGQVLKYNSSAGAWEPATDASGSAAASGSNFGGGQEVFTGVSGSDLNFRTFAAGPGATVNTNGDVIEVSGAVTPLSRVYIDPSSVTAYSASAGEFIMVDFNTINGALGVGRPDTAVKINLPNESALNEGSKIGIMIQNNSIDTTGVLNNPVYVDFGDTNSGLVEPSNGNAPVFHQFANPNDMAFYEVYGDDVNIEKAWRLTARSQGSKYAPIDAAHHFVETTSNTATPQIRRVLRYFSKYAPGEGSGGTIVNGVRVSFDVTATSGTLAGGYTFAEWKGTAFFYTGSSGMVQHNVTFDTIRKDTAAASWNINFAVNGPGIECWVTGSSGGVTVFSPTFTVLDQTIMGSGI